MVATNEGRCCDAVLRILEQQCGTKRQDLVRDTPKRPGIDVECTIGGRHFAIEHTLIEPFPDYQVDNIALDRVFDADFEAALREFMRPHLAYTISVEVYAFQGMDTSSLAATRSALLVWALNAVQRLPEPAVSGLPERRLCGEPPQAPVPVTLACHRSSYVGGRLLPMRVAPPALEELRRARLLTALKDKGPKLHAVRRRATRTVLIVENHDYAITNESTVSAVFDELAADAKNMPDDIYMVSTGIPPHFHVTQVRCDGRMCVFMGSKADDWSFEASTLTEI